MAKNGVSIDIFESYAYMQLHYSNYYILNKFLHLLQR